MEAVKARLCRGRWGSWAPGPELSWSSTGRRAPSPALPQACPGLCWPRLGGGLGVGRVLAAQGQQAGPRELAMKNV